MSAAGELDCRVTIQQRARTRDSFGGTAIGWSDYKTVWAKVSQLRGAEMIAAQQVQSRIDTRIRIRHVNGLRTNMRVVQRVELDGSAPYRYFDIVQITPDQKRKSFVVLLCVQREADGFHVADTSADYSEPPP